MARFYVPYNFVPATGAINGATQNAAMDKWPANAGSARHDLWQKGNLSGAVACLLTTESPMGVGATIRPHGVAPHQELNDVSLYRRDGKAAVPANSLRGAIGSLMETLSQSALRVLDARKKMDRSSRRPGEHTPVLGDLHLAFADIAKNLLPLQPNRTELSPAELLLGVVSEGEHPLLQALASRLRFNDAICISGGRTLAAEVLQIMGTPHAKYPAFYYNQQNANVPDKMHFELLPGHANFVRPNGRKFYLHQRLADLESHWKEHPDASTVTDKQRVRVALVKAGKQFVFHIDFENLTPQELHLLLVALEPAADFRHRIGLGKPLGLGKVRIQVLGLQTQDRSQRYQMNSNVGECYRCASIPAHQPTSKKTNELLQQILGAAVQTSLQAVVASLVEGDGLIDQNSLKILCLIGNPSLIEAAPTVYPRTAQQLGHWQRRDNRSANEELFTWFQANNGTTSPAKQQLPKIDPENFPPPLQTQV